LGATHLSLNLSLAKTWTGYQLGHKNFEKERREKRRGWCRIFTKHLCPEAVQAAPR